MNKMTINIGGSQREVCFGLKAVGDIIDHDNMGLEGLGRLMRSNPIKSTPIIIYYGLVSSSERNGKFADFTLNDVFDWVEQKGLGDKELIQAIVLFGECFGKYISDLTKEQTKEGEEKKS